MLYLLSPWMEAKQAITRLKWASPVKQSVANPTPMQTYHPIHSREKVFPRQELVGSRSLSRICHHKSLAYISLRLH